MLRVVFAGSPDIASHALEDIIKSNCCEIVAVLSNPPATQGRHKELVNTPVVCVAENANQQNTLKNKILVLTPQKLDEAVRNTIQSLKPDLLVCFAYGKIFGPKFMSLFPLGGINLHPSLLPKFRGCAPVPAAILAGEKETGITIQRLAPEMDSGDIIFQKVIPLNGTETAGSLLQLVGEQSGNLLANCICKIEECKNTGNKLECSQQDNSKATYCNMLSKTDGDIDWNKDAYSICAKIRAFSPWPSAFTCANGIILKIHEAKVFNGVFHFAELGKSENDFQPGSVIGSDKQNGILIQTGNGILAVTNLQWQAKKAVDWKDFLNGSRNFIGTILKSV